MLNVNRLRVVLLLVVAALCFAQERQTRREFEVATIRPVNLEGRQFPPTTLRLYPQRIEYSYVMLSEVTRLAYDLPGWRMTWPTQLNDRKFALFSIAATFPEGTTQAGIREMLQHLLEDRFALKIHWAKRPTSVYEVKVAPGGVKLRRSKYDPNEKTDMKDDAQREERNLHTVFQSQEGVRIKGIISIPQLLGILGADLGTPMIDGTGLEGYYDIDFLWSQPYVPPVPPGQPTTGGAPIPEVSKTATLFPALEKQLGLKAVAAKYDVDFLTIDSINREPTEN